MKTPKEIIEHILQEANRQGAEFCEAVVWKEEAQLKRVKNGQVDQPPAGEEWGIDVALIKGNKKRSLSFDDPDFAKEGIRQAMDSFSYVQEQNAALPEETFSPVAEPEGLFDKETSRLDSENSIALIRRLNEALEKEGLTLSGKVAQVQGELAYANSLGTRQGIRFTTANATVFAFDKEDASISAYANSGGTSIHAIETERLIEELTKKCLFQRQAKRVDIFEGKEDGEDLHMDVIVEPYVLESLFEWLGFFGFNGLFVERGESFISGKIGSLVTGSHINIIDNPFDKRARGLGLPFDFEGRPRTRLPLVEGGIAKTAVYDTQLARQFGKRPTGNALNPSSRSEGSAPFDLVIEGNFPKTQSVEEMIASCKRPALWITKLHYLGMKHYQTATMTGVAQHGSFLIEDGKVAAPVENVRFEEKIPEVLARATACSPSRLVYAPLGFGMPSGLVAPAMKIEGFRFVGSTKRTT